MLDKKNFFVFGMAKSGAAAALLLARKDYSVTVYDDDKEVLSVFMATPETAGFENRIKAVDKSGASESVRRSDCLVLSPGIPLEHALVDTARKSSVEVIGELELAYQFCSSKVIGVTGTNGKSTVVNIIGRILETAGKRAVVAGNVGTPFSSVVSDEDAFDIAVLEVSSFQLDTIVDFKSDIAVLLNVTPDHLDRYGDSFDEYVKSKARILNRSDAETVFVYNAGDNACLSMAAGFEGRKIAFSSARSLEEGVCLEDDMIIREWSGRKERVIQRSEFTPVGIHNAENALAAVAAVTPFGIEKETIAEALRSYHPLPHRMELVRVAGGVAYINDSKATNVDAAVKSLRSIDGRVILIIGGRDKNGDFSMLLPHLDHVVKVIVLGEAAAKIESAIQGQRPVQHASSLEEAVLAAKETAEPGDTVLLAPACASFDMFRDYTDRGDVFRASVGAL
ncbi:MAG: UDP-N-acetylmuramoyl-L-alanine--D-glutamate ligase [Candidatus Latescibacteria bacterium]|nr:UDP-N-acetylmuramoyl-L-alanine--D-glutamate ligase [Candidatus Latescibacterota bacterium]NIM21074.1 UDP-N-acetylmuramoyl-L-alanine--D-glutamate ligase [Candidatus Latescibacterota bacterium]NIM65209.1 UDP-N-acetylmuramoyl-L-alanine--D-glutamate ligase [Candidatus Latescibacterota bacterium]NIO01724.1 UDP-N-acetylmuramoyl-L-alanine--D-glutamate ligase [Candidatus Latescibacterota bacterium]NIO28241.1 UDP-N-acetylmuramoyl-L-alanine--D-glutamate ligase [Candidatus Latescibacterota bacterium]